MLKSNDYKLFFRDMLMEFQRDGYTDFTVRENFIPAEAVPDDQKEEFLKSGPPIAFDQKVYGYTITISHAGNIIYFNFVCFNMREEYVNKGLAEGKDGIVLMPPQLLDMFWHKLFVDLLCSGMVANRDTYYEGKAKQTNPEDRPGELDVQPEKGGRIRSIHDTGNSHN